MAQILKIAKDTLYDFPELIEEGYKETDFSRIWQSYEKEMNDFLLDPSKVYFKLFGVLYFGLDYKGLNKKINKLLLFSSSTSVVPLYEIDYEHLKTKIDKLKRIIEQKINHYEDVLYYIEGCNYEKSKKIINLNINNLRDLLKKCEIIKSNYDKRIITRNLEKQSSDSGGDKEPHI